MPTIRGYLADYQASEQRYRKACEKAEKRNVEPPAQAYWDRDDHAVTFADVAARLIERLLELQPAAAAALQEYASPDPLLSTTQHHANRAPELRDALEKIIKELT